MAKNKKEVEEKITPKIENSIEDPKIELPKLIVIFKEHDLPSHIAAALFRKEYDVTLIPCGGGYQFLEDEVPLETDIILINSTIKLRQARLIPDGNITYFADKADDYKEKVGVDKVIVTKEGEYIFDSVFNFLFGKKSQLPFVLSEFDNPNVRIGLEYFSRHVDDNDLFEALHNDSVEAEQMISVVGSTISMYEQSIKPFWEVKE